MISYTEALTTPSLVSIHATSIHIKWCIMQILFAQFERRSRNLCHALNLSPLLFCTLLRLLSFFGTLSRTNLFQPECLGPFPHVSQTERPQTTLLHSSLPLSKTLFTSFQTNPFSQPPLCRSSSCLAHKPQLKQLLLCPVCQFPSRTCSFENIANRFSLNKKM